MDLPGSPRSKSPGAPCLQKFPSIWIHRVERWPYPLSSCCSLLVPCLDRRGLCCNPLEIDSIALITFDLYHTSFLYMQKDLWVIITYRFPKLGDPFKICLPLSGWEASHTPWPLFVKKTGLRMISWDTSPLGRLQSKETFISSFVSFFGISSTSFLLILAATDSLFLQTDQFVLIQMYLWTDLLCTTCPISYAEGKGSWYFRWPIWKSNIWKCIWRPEKSINLICSRQLELAVIWGRRPNDDNQQLNKLAKLRRCVSQTSIRSNEFGPD